MPQDWSTQPEAAGPVSERRPRAFNDGLERFPEAAGPQSETPGVDYGSPGQIRIGRIEPQLDRATVDRERAEADRRYYLREQVERAALQAGLTALQAAEAAQRITTEAREAADRAVNRS
jgi:hypothetical protein